MKRVEIPVAHAVAFEVASGETFEIVDPEGQQVSDLAMFDSTDVSERFSPKYTCARTGRLRITEGDSLYTTRGRPIATILRDDCGVHDILHGPGTGWLLAELEGRERPVKGCHENLCEVLEPWDIPPATLFDVMNVFMKSTITNQTDVEVKEPESEPGDTITFKAERDAVVGVTACASESVTNAGGTTSIAVHVPGGTEVNRNFR